ncbi:MAG: hypothetical protein RLO52_10090 [Sandaracinaceae bacterium]|nr:MAG: hypothetical protein EVA89_31440 [Sandaracinaceae bacterium]HBQ16325.1 hypothetical protein [Myxococcales bacterium]
MDNASDSLEPLYTHTKRPDWGYAILAWEGREKRRYQFQDGQLRTFKKGWYDLLEPVDEPYDSARDIVRDLKSMLRIERVRRAPDPTPKSVNRIISFDDQVTIFEAFYPKGFEDEKWISDVRGGEGVNRLKRHRYPAHLEAAEKLEQSIVDGLMEKGDHAGLIELFKEVLSCTNLTTSKDTASLRSLPEEHHEDFANAARELLYGEGPYESRFTRYVGILGRTPGERVTWPLATAVPALVQPVQHVAIKPSVFRAQAQWMAPNLPYDAYPTADLYNRMHKMSTEVARRLEKAGHKPNDLLDIYDFIWTTLRPKGRKKLEELQEN